MLRGLEFEPLADELRGLGELAGQRVARRSPVSQADAPLPHWYAATLTDRDVGDAAEITVGAAGLNRMLDFGHPKPVRIALSRHGEWPISCPRRLHATR